MLAPHPTRATRVRLDKLLVDRQLVPSRERAQALILAGRVLVDEQKVQKSGNPTLTDAQIRLLGDDLRYVGRGGLKLERAVEHWAIDLAGKACADIGASTGGFTDVLLARGAARVHAVDVGHGQLAWKLRSDPRVAVHEKTNARHLTRGQIGEAAGAVVCDASFIGLATVLPASLDLCAPDAWAVALIKPQFEAGPEAVGSKGVVRDPAIHAMVCERVRAWWEARPGWTVLGIVESPITGPEGNREFLIGATRG
jgi:23S rRNA (cytidine1920-2'-O)/16S rRNA (cytidine1409-2'-O)-methyltransferase